MSLIGESFGMITGYVLSGGKVSEVLVFGNSVLTLDSTGSWVLLVSMDAVDVVSMLFVNITFCCRDILIFSLKFQILLWQFFFFNFKQCY